MHTNTHTVNALSTLSFPPLRPSVAYAGHPRNIPTLYLRVRDFPSAFRSNNGIIEISHQGRKSTFVVRPLQFVVGPQPCLTRALDFFKQCVRKDINQTMDNIDVDLV